MIFKPKVNNPFSPYGKTYYANKFFKHNRLNKWSSMPTLQIHNKQSGISITNKENDQTQLYATHSMNLSSPDYYELTDNVEKRSGFESIINNRKAEDVVSSNNETNEVKHQQIMSSPESSMKNTMSSIVSSESLECPIENSDIFASEESMCEQLFDASLLSLDESDANSLVNVLNTLKFKDGPDEVLNMKSREEKGKLKNENNKNSLPAKNTEDQFHINYYIARRKLNYAGLRNSIFTGQENKTESEESNLLLKDNFSREYLMKFKDRLKEIRKENLTISMAKKHIRNGNRFSRVFNYCFLLR